MKLLLVAILLFIFLEPGFILSYNSSLNATPFKEDWWVKTGSKTFEYLAFSLTAFEVIRIDK